MQSVRLILPFSLVASVFFVTSLATGNGGDQSKLKGKSLLSHDVHLADNLAEEKEENLGSLASPSLVNPKWATHLSLGHTGHKAKPSSFESSFQWRPSQTLPDHLSDVIPPSSFQNRGPALVPFRSEEGLSFFENQSTQNSQFGGGPVGRPLRETFAEERQFRPGRPPPPPPPGQPLPQRPQRGPPRNLGRPVFLQDNPALSPPPPPRPTPSSFNLPTPTHPDISLIPLQDSGVSGVNDLLEERFPPFNDEPLSPAQLAAVSRDPAVTTQQPFLQFITQDEPLPLSHQSPGELTQQVPLSQLLETPRSHPRQNSTTRPRHLGSLFPQSQQQRVTPITQQPTTTPTQKPTSPPTQPIRVEPPQPPQSPNDVTHGIFPGLNPSHQPFFEGPTAQFSFDGPSGPSFEQIPQLLPPPQFPPQELNHIPQEPPLLLAKPTDPRPPRQKTQPGFQQPFRPAPAQKPTGQEPPEEAFPSQNQPFNPPNPPPAPSDPSPPPTPSSGPTGRPSFPFQFQRPPQRPARGQPNFRPPPPPPPRGRRRPIPVRIRDPRRPRQQTTPPVPQNVASRRPRSEGPLQAREHSAEGQFQQGLISPFASGEDQLFWEEPLPDFTLPLSEHSLHSAPPLPSPPPPPPPPSADALPIPTGIPLVFGLASDPSQRELGPTVISGKPPVIQRAKSAQQTISKVWNRFTKNVARTTAEVAGTVGHVTGRALGEGAALLSSAGNAMKQAIGQMDSYRSDYSDPPKAHSLSSGFQITLPNHTHITEHKFGLRFSMSSNLQGGPPMPLVGVDLDSDVVSRPRDPYQERKKKAFLKPYVEVTSVPVHPVVSYQLPRYKTQVVHVRPWKTPEPKSSRGTEPSSSQSHSSVSGPSEQGYNKEQAFQINGPGPSEQGHNKEQAFQINGPGPSEQGHNKEQAFQINGPGPSEQGHKEQAFQINGPGPSEQGYNKEQAFQINGPGPSKQGYNKEQGHKEQAFKISGPLPYKDYDFVDETYNGEGESDYEFYDDEYYDEQPLDDGDFPRFLDQSPFRDIFTHSSSSHEQYRPFDITRHDFFGGDHPSRGYHPPPSSHLRRDEDDHSPPGIKNIISHIRRNVHDQVVKEPEIASLLGKSLLNRSLEDQRDDYPDNIQEIKEIINHPKYPLDYYRSGIPARGDHKTLHGQRGPPFRFP